LPPAKDWGERLQRATTAIKKVTSQAEKSLLSDKGDKIEK
jgi:hypothetical protein